MINHDQHPLLNLDVDAALRTILEGTSTETGAHFFQALVRNLASALNTYGAWVTEYIQECRQLRALAFWLDGEFIHDFDMNVSGTPCETVIEQARLVHFPDNLLGFYPNNPNIKRFGLRSYLGVPLLDLNNKVLGHLAVLDTRPLPEEPRTLALFQIFAARAAAELRRLMAESQVREREEKLGRLVDSALDAIIELDRNLKITRVNPAGEKVFECAAKEIIGSSFSRFLTIETAEKLAQLANHLDLRPEGERYLWIPGGLNALSARGKEFAAEATLSRFELQHEPFFTLILRNVNERLEAEQRIRSLTVEAEYLKEEIKELRQFDEIIGQSESLRRVLHDVKEVAPTDATVLILGETGTGKELFARAIHLASARGNKALIKVNCAAIPGALIESELFGHEQGAFTGATKKRQGRFALADGGTIFLDEIGELPLDLQPKLLRALQEGEFEPVGSSQTRKVDVRILAATNRNLHEAVREGKFREDLYYRLNVFPIDIPPLRERGDDIGLLAAFFANWFGQRMGRSLKPLSPEDIRRLKAYSWPGNVRELENVIERATITARNGQLNFDRALPETINYKPVDAAPSDEAPKPVRTSREIERLERDNIMAALERANWQVSGENGAARLLDMKPSTLSSRIKALGIKRAR
jgi:PAS domain S-box-containing protein